MAWAPTASAPPCSMQQSRSPSFWWGLRSSSSLLRSATWVGTKWNLSPGLRERCPGPFAHPIGCTAGDRVEHSLALRSARDAKPAQRVRVDLDPEACPGGDRNPALLVLDRGGQERRADRMFGAVELQHRLDRVER